MDSPAALFAGLCTLDVIQAVERAPGPNEKITALDQAVAAGGPAANAAVTFAFLGGNATLLTGVGQHPLAEGIRADLIQAGVRLTDTAAGDGRPPPVSSVLVTRGTGDRSVVSRNAAGRDLAPPPGLPSLVRQARAVLIDGHHPRLAEAAARTAREQGRPCVLDGGSWKDNTASLLPHVDAAVCSADFRPPGADGGDGVLEYLLRRGVRWAAVTDGPRPVAWAGPDGRSGTVAVPAVTVADTLGAGDVFHGAFTYAIAAHGIADDNAFLSALRSGAEVAARSCRAFGTRAWMGC